jgi:hypothetical protein
MKRREADAILEQRLGELRRLPYSELERLLGNDEVTEISASSGTTYYMEVEALWDDRRRGHLRVLASIDDGGLRAFCPLSKSFIVTPDGRFVGE